VLLSLSSTREHETRFMGRAPGSERQILIIDSRSPPTNVTSSCVNDAGRGRSKVARFSGVRRDSTSSYFRSFHVGAHPINLPSNRSRFSISASQARAIELSASQRRIRRFTGEGTFSRKRRFREYRAAPYRDRLIKHDMINCSGLSSRACTRGIC